MNLQEKLLLLKAKHSHKAIKGALPVYYGWAKLNKIQKREALMVIFLNDHPGPRVGKDGECGVTKWIVPVYKRWQTKAEMQDAASCNRMYTVYSIFMDDRKIKGSLTLALEANFNADKNHVSVSERNEIMEKLRNSYLENHIGYRETNIQLSFNFDE